MTGVQTGDVFLLEETITEEMINTFALLSGDTNPLHMDDDFAKSCGFSGRVAHGILLLGMISRLVGMRIAHQETLLHGLQVRFSQPVYAGDHVYMEARVASVSPAVMAMELHVTALRLPEKTVVFRAKVQVGIPGRL